MVYFCTVIDAAAIYALIEQRRSELGLSQAQLGQRAFGQANSAAIQNLRRGSSPTADRLSALAEALDLDFYFGRKRAHETPVATIEINGDEFAAVPRVNAEASAGPGRSNGETEVVGSLAFRLDWLRDHGVRPDQALLVTVTGNSMEPRITAGDLVLVDLAHTDIVNGAPFLFNDADGETRIKRLHRLGARTVALVSDNPDHPPELRNGIDAERIRVLGKIVWSGHNWS